MPTYEYTCKSCGQPTEHFASMSAKPLKKCPHCGKNQLQRQIGTGAGFIFKGGGFYETDYRSEGYKKAAEADKPASDKSTSDKPDKSGKKEAKTDKPGEGKKPDAPIAEPRKPDPTPPKSKPD